MKKLDENHNILHQLSIFLGHDLDGNLCQHMVYFKNQHLLNDEIVVKLMVCSNLIYKLLGYYLHYIT